MVDKKEIMRLLKQYFRTTGKITIDDEGLVSCNGDVILKQEQRHERLPVAFDRVGGNFWCWNNQLTTLAGAPQSVDRNFSCYNNQLTTLEGATQSVGGDFSCSNNQLTTLAGAPQSVGGAFLCNNNQLTTLAGAPQRVGASFDCSYNQLTTLEGAPQSVGGSFNCIHIQLTTLQGLPAVPGTLFLSYSPTLPLLRCLLAKKVEFVPELNNTTIETILNKYAGKGRREMFWCQKELEDAGFTENARW
jgi:hypothetical protein